MGPYLGADHTDAPPQLPGRKVWLLAAVSQRNPPRSAGYSETRSRFVFGSNKAPPQADDDHFNEQRPNKVRAPHIVLEAARCHALPTERLSGVQHGIDYTR